MSHMHLPRLSRLTALLVVAAAAFPAAAYASHSQVTMFQATRELRSPDPGIRAQTLDEIRSLGVRWLRVVLYWRDVAPRRTRGGSPVLGDRPERLSRLGGLRPDRVRGARPRHAHPAQRERAGPRLGDPRPRRGDAAEPDAVPAVHDRGRAPVPASGGRVVDLERAEPSAVPRAAVRARAAVLAPALPPALLGRTRGPGALGQPARSRAHGGDGARVATATSWRRWPSCAARSV